jgi:hypothetical protein
VIEVTNVQHEPINDGGLYEQMMKKLTMKMIIPLMH